MNILIANQQGIHPNAGGIENISWNLALELKKLGHKIFFLSFIKPFNENCLQKLEPNFDNYYFPNKNIECCNENISFTEKILSELNIDIILNQSANILSFSKVLIEAKENTNVPVTLVSALHFYPAYYIKDVEDTLFGKARIGNNPIYWGKSIIRSLAYKLYKLRKIKKAESVKYNYIYTNSDSFVLLSDSYREIFKQISKIDHYEKLVSIGNSIQRKSLKRESIENKEKTVLFVGRLVRSLKRPDRMIKIWETLHKENPDWNLKILGDGHYRKYLEEYVFIKKIQNIEFVGITSPEEHYKDASILCMTSTAEGLPLVLAEAQQQGCIPCAYDSFESVKDIITHGKDGILVKPFDSKEYISRIQYIMDNNDFRNDLIINCIEKDYSNFEIEYIAGIWIDLFNKLKNKKT